MNPTSNRPAAAFQQTLLSARRTMVLSEILKLALDSFRASKLRFALTALGMVIGTASVILVVTIGLTGKQFILNEIQKIGTNSVELEYSGGGATGAEQRALQRLPHPRRREGCAGAVARRDVLLAGAGDARPHQLWRRRGEGHAGAGRQPAVSAYPQPARARRAASSTRPTTPPTSSAPWSPSRSPRERFGSADAAVGQTFEISGIPFTIIGVFKESVDDFGESEIADQTILIPYSVARYFTGTENVKQIYFSMRTMDEVPDAANEIERIVQSRHRPNSVYKAQT